MKQQYLALLRVFWSCVGGWLLSVHTAQATPIKGYVMDVEMVPAVCALDRKKNKNRKCVEGYSLNIEGLYPDPQQSNCVTQSSATLLPLQAKVISRVMPDAAARKKLWHDYGGCMPMQATQYFRTIINYADRLNVPLELSAADSKTSTVNALKMQFLKLNKTMSSDAVHFSCRVLGREHVLTGIKICYSTKGHYQRCPKTVISNCPNRFLIKGSF